MTGKNRPLDEDEMEFMNTLADKELSRRRELQEAEKEELSAFQEVSKLLLCKFCQHSSSLRSSLMNYTVVS